MKKAFSMILVATLVIGLFSGCSASSAKGDLGGKDVINVNGTGLTSKYIDARIDQVFQQNQLEKDDPTAEYYKSQIISSLVDTELIVQEAKKQGVKVTDKDIDSFKKDLIEKRYGSEENFEKYLKEYNVSDSLLKRMLEEKIYYDKLTDKMKKDVKVDAEKYFNENKDQFNVGDQVKASHILVKDEEKANEIIKKLDNNEEFATLAKENSIDDGTKENGGELGYFTADTMVQEFSDAAFALNIGEYTKTPVKTQYGYHIIKIEDKKAAHQQTFDEVKDDLTESLKTQEVQAKFDELITKLRKNAKIEYKSDEYNPDKIAEKAQKAAEKAQSESDGQSSANAEQPAISPDQASN